MTRRYHIVIKYADGTVNHDATYDYGRTESQVLKDAMALHSDADEVLVTTDPAMADRLARQPIVVF